MKILVLLIICVWFGISENKEITKRSILNNELNTDSETDNIFDSSWVSIKAKRNEIRAYVGESVLLECDASGSPQPKIQFYKDASELTKHDIYANGIVENSNSALIKAKARLYMIVRETEVIFCKATSGSKTVYTAIKIYATGATSNNDLWNYENKEDLIHDIPRITFFYTMYLDNIGNTVVLPCAVSEDINEIVWVDPKQNIIEEGDDKRFAISPSGDLKIVNIQWSDMGPYRCVVRNHFGKDSITTFLYPMLVEE